ncbi:hypothetical protein HID58_028992 [Brassica napus]|uniref:Phosphoglycerate kinase n=1 Tax=Brassica napus TaxID=3708 RepID=A0ABQ8CBV7_BRANA|nr:hypothetical protein HID58_028992 [Brassica napus]
MSKQWRETDQEVESDRASGGVRWIAGGGTSRVELMEQVPAFEVFVNGGMKLLENNLPLDSVYKSKDVLLLLFVSFSDKNWSLVGFH